MFRILALETSELVGSVAAAADGQILAELPLPPDQRSAQSLAPAIRGLLERVAWRPRDIDLVAVTIGPGSFTGLRVGVATAKVFAYAAEAEVLGISTLEAIAAGTPSDISAIVTVIDAQRGDAVAQSFRSSDAGWRVPAGEAMLVPLEEWLAGLPAGLAVAGPVLKKRTFSPPPGVTILDSAYWRPTAGNVARLAHRDYLAGRRDSLWDLLPVYSRASAAEEKWKHGKR